MAWSLHTLPLFLMCAVMFAAVDAAAAKAGKASDDRPKAATEADAAPKAVAKPRRDRKVCATPLPAYKGCFV